MNTTNTKKTECPDNEYVSAYFDGELSSESAEFTHIKKCPECQKQLKSYQILADKLKEELSSSIPDDLSAKIIAGVKKRNNRKSKHSLINFPIMLRLAALFVITGFALFLIFPKKTQENNTITEITPKPVFLNTDISPEHMTTMNFPSNDRIAGNGTIDLKDFFPASTGTRNEINFVDNNSEEKPALIPQKVKQVWVVKNVDDGIREFAKFAKNDQITFEQNNNGNTKIKLKISKLKLIELVRQCNKAGFKLLSPTQPQPEQNTFAGNKNDMVDYQAVFTSRR